MKSTPDSLSGENVRGTPKSLGSSPIRRPNTHLRNMLSKLDSKISKMDSRLAFIFKVLGIFPELDKKYPKLLLKRDKLDKLRLQTRLERKKYIVK